MMDINKDGQGRSNNTGYPADTANEEDFSQISIKTDVIASIAGKAALEVIGVLGIDGGISGGLAAALRRDNTASGIKVLLEDNKFIISVSVITKYGMRIPEIAWNLQEHIKKNVEDTAGIAVHKVNVLITGIKST